jgi:molecular chaperone DnaK (HSP70)
MNSDRIVGIDLGTTNSLVAFMQGESPVVIPGEDGLNLVPSVVALDEKEQIIVGGVGPIGAGNLDARRVGVCRRGTGTARDQQRRGAQG